MHRRFETPSAQDAAFLGPLLGFRPIVSARFEAETRVERVAHLRRTILIGLGFYNAYIATDWLLTPSVFWLGLLLRAGFITAAGLAIYAAVGRLSAVIREIVTTAGVAGAVAVPICLFWIASEPWAVLKAGDALLTLVFGTVILGLRFRMALLFIGFTGAVATAAFWTKPGLGSAVAFTLTLQLLTAGCFVAYGSYRIQLNERRIYLRALRESLRSDGLEADKQALQQLSNVDALTGIANRRALFERLSAWVNAGDRQQPPLALLMVDVDHFKRFNDHYGHPRGDACLKRLAAAMSGALRNGDDLLARYGGEEFAVLLPGADLSVARLIGERLQHAVEALALPHVNRGDGLRVATVSVGVAIGEPAARPSARDLLHAADAALYEAKRLGRNRLAVADAVVRIPDTQPMEYDAA